MDGQRDPRLPAQAARIAERLAAARGQRFVGRRSEIELFRAALTAPEPPFALLFLYGPGGVGKTTLLDAYARLAAEDGIPSARIDGRAIEPSPSGFLLALGLATGITDPTALPGALDGHSRFVLFLDTYERMAPLDAWLRDTFLPQLPAHVLVVIAGRNPPAPAWRADPGWGELVRVVPLRNLRPDESRAYLRARAVPEHHDPAVLAFTHGHPLALSLVADVLAQGDTTGATRPIDDPDVVRVLLERFVEGTPSRAHRQALEICAHVRVTTEALLAEALTEGNPSDIFAWLRGLSFIEQGPEGIYPHDLARDVLDADLRWRNPDDYRELHRRVRGYIVRRLQQARGIELQRAFFDLLYLHRHSPLMQPYVQWTALGTAYAEPATAADSSAILDMVRRHEGEDAAAIARHWLARQPGAFTVFRGAGGDVLGFVASLALQETTEEDRALDPGVRAAWDFAQRYGPARPGEVMLLHRFAMARDTYQLASGTFDMVVMHTTTQWLTTPGLAWTFVIFADAEYWRPVMSYINFRRATVADFTVEDRTYQVFAHDWRAEPPLAWLDLMAERELASDLTVEQVEAAPPPPLIVLSQPEFEQAVRQALRAYTQPEALEHNPLLRSRLVAEHGGDDPVAALQALIRDAVQRLRALPRGERLYRAVQRTYIVPAATQEAAAEALGLPFSTFRYHLTTGVDRIVDYLWQRELYGASDSRE